MDIFLKSAAGALITLILYLVLSKQSKDLSLLLTVIACAILAATAISYLEPVIDFFQKLLLIGQLDAEFFSIVLKAVGIGLLAEISGLICADAGNSALGKTLNIMASAVILWMSVPLFTSLLELVEEILVAV